MKIPLVQTKNMCKNISTPKLTQLPASFSCALAITSGSREGALFCATGNHFITTSK